jgi:lysophospholipid acyltransferase
VGRALRREKKYWFCYNWHARGSSISSVSLFYLVGIFDLWGGLGTLLVSSVGAYLIAARIRSPYMPWIGFFFLMGHMSISHIKRQTEAAPHVIDISGKAYT